MPFDRCDSDACRKCNLHGNPSNCLFARPFCSSANASLCGGGISYGGSSSYLGGPWVTDVVDFGGYKTESVVMAISDQFPAGGFGLGGILGLAHDWNACNPTCVGTVFGDIVEEYKIENKFGLCLTKENGGVLDLGFVDDSKYSGELQYINVTKQRWYNMPLLDIKFNGSSIGVEPYMYHFQNDAIGTFIDSGTSVMLFGPYIYQSIVNLWQDKFCSLPSALAVFCVACHTMLLLKELFCALLTPHQQTCASQVVAPSSMATAWTPAKPAP